MTNNFYYFH